ncbi:hypothetical protein PT285_09710 [Lactobacillus sp. ESL0791]|uniref:hypothetical protein n=1 Tax=Lactobacillus sp. ESL0791 TaxID=2983234 RepID=UPI0023F80F42|nr:hypothetical protein [Lactobacillus sp. ESL0791]MDF7639675.1 hypothetical protein [Lactobacillus sp. ESL0791]
MTFKKVLMTDSLTKKICEDLAREKEQLLPAEENHRSKTEWLIISLSGVFTLIIIIGMILPFLKLK